MYSVYIIASPEDKWYYGSTGKLEQRLADHNNNRSKHTSFKGPWILIFRRDFADKTEALRFELQLKRMRNKDYIRRTYSEYFLNS